MTTAISIVLNFFCPIQKNRNYFDDQTNVQVFFKVLWEDISVIDIYINLKSHCLSCMKAEGLDFKFKLFLSLKFHFCILYLIK